MTYQIKPIIKLIFTIFLMLGLTACNNPYIVKNIGYQGTLTPGKSTITADIRWQSGQIKADYASLFAIGILNCYGCPTPVSLALFPLMVSAESLVGASYPYSGIVAYDVAQQAVFVTQFRDLLLQLHLFKSVTIIPASAPMRADVLISLHFNRTSVDYDSHKSPLTVFLTLKAQPNDTVLPVHEPALYKRYSVTPELSTLGAINKNYEDIVQQASNYLMTNILDNLADWLRKTYYPKVELAYAG